MQIFNPLIPFPFNYPSDGLESGLFVQASIYDVSTGTPSLVAETALTEIQNGFYSANFTGLSGKTYLVICAVYTDGTFTTIDTTKAPWADCYKSADAPVLFAAFNYGVYTQDPSLFIGASIYDCISGTPTFIQKINMAHVFAGVYFCVFTGVNGHCYEVLKFIYTDMALTTIDLNWNAGSDIFQLFPGGAGNGSVLLQSANLKGQSLVASLRGQSLKAVLKETIS